MKRSLHKNFTRIAWTAWWPGIHVWQGIFMFFGCIASCFIFAVIFALLMLSNLYLCWWQVWPAPILILLGSVQIPRFDQPMKAKMKMHLMGNTIDSSFTIMYLTRSLKGSPNQIHAGGIWAFAWFWGGSEPLPGWFGALMQWKLKLKWAFACVKEGVKACQDALCTYVPSKRWFGKFAQIGPEKKCPRVPVWVRVGGCNRYLGNAQIEVTLISKGLP